MTFDVSRVRALCFDVDGTLSDTDDLYVQKVSRWLPRLLFNQRERAARRIVMWLESPGNALLTLGDSLGIDDAAVALIDWMYRHRKKTWKKFLLVPGVDTMLARLYRRYPLAVVSSRAEQSTMAFLERFDLTKYFEVIVTGQSTEHTKPYPDPILLAARKMHAAPEHCLMIGDTTVDIRAGKSAGAQAVGVLCGFGEEAELRRMGADLILASTPQVADVLLAEQ
jgi:HAD superfamily hydrolase (TIGR01509 family)